MFVAACAQRERQLRNFRPESIRLLEARKISIAALKAIMQMGLVFPQLGLLFIPLFVRWIWDFRNQAVAAAAALTASRFIGGWGVTRGRWAVQLVLTSVAAASALAAVGHHHH